jgi:RNA polymerase sigma factor (sigma-70 family)
MQPNMGSTTESTGDGELVERCLAGDREAYGLLVARYQSLICAVAYSACGDLARSEDLAQETFFAAWRQLAGLRDRARFKSWVCGIARNLVHNSLRREARDRLRGARPLDSIPEPPSATPTPREQTVSDEEENLLWRTLSEIPETYREPLVLFYREQQSVAQVAAALDLSPDAVKQRLSRGRALLKHEIAAFVETRLRNTRPGKAFTIGVLVALPAIVPSATAAGLVAGASKSSAAKSGAALGFSGGVLGPLIGLLGAYLGAKASIENTRSPRERRFMIRQTWWAGAYVLAFLAALIMAMTFGKRLLPEHPVAFAGLLVALVAGYLAGLLAMVLRSNRRQRDIQIEEGTYVPPAVLQSRLLSSSPERFRRGIYGGLGGGVFGSVAWAGLEAGRHSDWITLGGLTGMALCAWVVGGKAAVKNPRKSLRVLLVTVISVAFLSLSVVDLRWKAWMAVSPGSAAAKHWTLIGINAFLALLLAVITGGILWNQRLHSRTAAPDSPGPPRPV